MLTPPSPRELKVNDIIFMQRGTHFTQQRLFSSALSPNHDLAPVDGTSDSQLLALPQKSIIVVDNDEIPQSWQSRVLNIPWHRVTELRECIGQHLNISRGSNVRYDEEVLDSD